jgi:uridine phosphorylase
MDNKKSSLTIPSSELILNPDGSIYHLGLKPEHLTDTIITVGDPERVAQVSRHFDRVDAKIQKREFVSHRGVYKGQELLVISSGIGTDNVEILLTELDALVNIDLSLRQVKNEHKTLKIIRVGTSGALQDDVALDSFLVSDYTIGLDTLMQFYELEQIPWLVICNFHSLLIVCKARHCSKARSERICRKELPLPVPVFMPHKGES